MKKINLGALLVAVSLFTSVQAFATDATPVPEMTETPAVTDIEKLDEVAAATLKPKFDLDTEGFVFGDTGEGTATEAPKEDEKQDTKATEKPQDTKEIRKVCGVDIPPGRYKVSGNGILKIICSNGAMKSESVISPSTGGSIVVLLEDKDVLIINPLEGEEKAKLKFDKASTDPSAVTAVEKNGTKTNPKTGENDFELIAFGVVAVLALAAFASLEVLKRKKNGNN